MFYALQSELDEKGAPDKSQALIKDLIKEWIRENEERQRTGQITQTTLRGKTSAMQGPISLYLLQHLRSIELKWSGSSLTPVSQRSPKGSQVLV